MKFDVVILAAGQGTRMRSALPKVLHPLAGKPLLQHVIDTAHQLGAANVHAVIGHGAEQVREQLADAQCQWVLQQEQLGTGHALAQALPNINPDHAVLVLYGDVPLVRPETLHALLMKQNRNGLGLLTAILEDPTGYGRILREQEAIVGIVEQKDATPEQLTITETNTGILVAPAARLQEWLPRLSSANAQGEYYLTDIVAMAVADGVEVIAHHPVEQWEVQGVNNRLQLAELERAYQYQQAERLLLEGASLADPARIDVRGQLMVGQDVSIDVNCVFEGRVVLHDGVRIGSNCVLRNTEIGPGSVVESHSVLVDAEVAGHCQIGPFARIRPGTCLEEGAKVGNFVEIKNSQLKPGSKVNHLSYIGDAVVGEGANVGAGTITCNYDGANKYRTEIGPGAFIGSNSSLVAPVIIGARATVAAGSTITNDIGSEQLGVARGRQRNIDGWNRPEKKVQKEK